MANNGKRITLSDETINKLAPIAEPFETIDECMSRVLGCKCVQKEMKKEKQNMESDE